MFRAVAISQKVTHLQSSDKQIDGLVRQHNTGISLGRSLPLKVMAMSHSVLCYCLSEPALTKISDGLLKHICRKTQGEGRDQQECGHCHCKC